MRYAGAGIPHETDDMKEKMIYEVFTDFLSMGVRKRLGERYKTEMTRSYQINGGFFNTMKIKEKGKTVCTLIETDPYYVLYKKGIDITAILDKLLDEYSLNTTIRKAVSDDMADYDSIKSRIVYRLINGYRNQRLLGEVPYINDSKNDFMIVFYIVDKEDTRVDTLICNNHLVRWGIDIKELMLRAMENTPRLHDVRISCMADVLEEMLRRTEVLLPGQPFMRLNEPCYVLTNSTVWYGATCILYKGALNHIAEQLGSDLMLLPSSLHEILILLYEPKNITLEEAGEIVRNVNTGYVSRQDFLSNSTYLYRRQSDSIEIFPKCDGPF